MGKKATSSTPKTKPQKKAKAKQHASTAAGKTSSKSTGKAKPDSKQTLLQFPASPKASTGINSRGSRSMSSSANVSVDSTTGVNSCDRDESTTLNPSQSVPGTSVSLSNVKDTNISIGDTGSVNACAGGVESASLSSYTGTLNRQDHISRLQEALDGIEKSNHYKSVGGDAVAHEWEDYCWGVFYDPDGKSDYAFSLYIFFCLFSGHTIFSSNNVES